MTGLGHWKVDPFCSIPLFFNFSPVYDYQKNVENMLSLLPVDVICVFCLSFILIEVLASMCMEQIIFLQQAGW